MAGSESPQGRFNPPAGCVADRTPGHLGRQDGADPNVCKAQKGDSPGFTGGKDLSDSLANEIKTHFEQRTDFPPTRDIDHIWLYPYNGETVILEFYRGRLITHKDGKLYYSVGEIYRPWTATKYQLEQWFPELKSSTSEEPSALQTALKIGLFLLGGLEERQYKGAWLITDIDYEGQWRGTVQQRPVIYFDEDSPVVLENYSELSRNQLNDVFAINHDILPVGRVIEVLGEFEMSAILAVMGGAAGGFRKLIGKKLGKQVARQAIKWQLQKLLRRVMSAFANAFVKSIITFCRAFTIEFAKDLDAAELKKRAMAPDAATLEAWLQQRVTKSVTAGAGAFATTLLVDTTEALMMKGFAKSLEDVLGLDKSLSKALQSYITGEVVKLCSTSLWRTLIKGITDSAKKAIDEKNHFDQAKFNESLLESLKDKFLDILKDEAKKWPETFGELLLKDATG